MSDFNINEEFIKDKFLKNNLILLDQVVINEFDKCITIFSKMEDIQFKYTVYNFGGKYRFKYRVSFYVEDYKKMETKYFYPPETDIIKVTDVIEYLSNVIPSHIDKVKNYM